MEEEEKFLIGDKVARNESSQTTCTSQKRKYQKCRCKYMYTNSAVHFTCNAHVQAHVNSNWYPCSGDKENQNPKRVKTVTVTKTATRSTGVHVACSSTCCTYLHVYFRSI